MEILDEELKRNEPNKIAFVSFTRKGAYEGRDRAIQKFNYKPEDFPYFRTLHSIAFREGGFTQQNMMQRSDYKKLSDALSMKFTGYYTEDFKNNDDMYIFYDILNRNNPMAAQDYLYQLDARILNFVQHNYRRYKEEFKVFDFTDIIEAFVKYKMSLPVDVAIIDEAQDLTELQWQMCFYAFRNCKRLYVAGDDDQAIYQWSGADVNTFLHLDGEREILKQSYRLQREVLEFSKMISSQIEERQDKEFNHVNDVGHVMFYNSIEELQVNSDESYYFLSRNNWFLQNHTEFLYRHALLFNNKDEPSVNDRHVKAINLFEHLRKERKMDDKTETMLKQYVKEQIDLSLPWYDNFKLDPIIIAYYKDLIKNKVKLSDRPKITVNTIHGVKGGEADNVVLMLDITRAVKLACDKNRDSELRCFYVGATRAKKNLHIIFSNSKDGYDDFITDEYRSRA